MPLSIIKLIISLGGGRRFKFTLEFDVTEIGPSRVSC